jgi:hypothetical protein
MATPKTGSRKVRRGAVALPPIGWREWIALPELGIDWIKVKVDTGARSSALHASQLEPFVRDGEDWVRFRVHPIQRTRVGEIEAVAPVVDRRKVRSSSGKASWRPVIETTIAWREHRWSIELTLANRDSMGFRMLLGRQAFRGRFLVDAGRSYFGGRPPRAARRGR